MSEDNSQKLKVLKELKITVIGAGGIGGIVAALIKDAGYDVEIVCKYQDYAELIMNSGLNVVGTRTVSNIKMPAVAKISELQDKKDIILMTVKATDLKEATEDLKPFLKEDSVIVTMENGIVEEEMANLVGKNRVIGCVTGFGATLLEKGKLDMTSTGEFVIGTRDNIEIPRINGVKEILESVVPTFISQNIIGDLYSKVIINSCITSLGAVCGLYLGEMMKIKKIRNIFLEIIREAVNVAKAAGIQIEPYGSSKLDYYNLVAKKGFFPELKRHLLIRIIGLKYKKLKSSSLQSLERGKPTEIHYLNGYICQKGKEFNVATPINDKIVEIIENIEEKKREISLTNFDDSVFERFG